MTSNGKGDTCEDINENEIESRSESESAIENGIESEPNIAATPDELKINPIDMKQKLRLSLPSDSSMKNETNDELSPLRIDRSKSLDPAQADGFDGTIRRFSILSNCTGAAILEDVPEPKRKKNRKWSV